MPWRRVMESPEAIPDQRAWGKQRPSLDQATGMPAYCKPFCGPWDP